MTEEIAETSLESLRWLRSAASDFAHNEIIKIVQATITNLQSRPPVGIFSDVAARHMWDEYCWNLQEGPFDHPEYAGRLRPGSVAGSWRDTVQDVVHGEVEKLPQYAKIFLCVVACDESVGSDEEMVAVNIGVDGIIETVMGEINQRASRQNLDLIGPDRGYVIPYEIEGAGMVWTILSSGGEALDMIAAHVDVMIDPEGDLSELAEEMIEAFMVTAADDEDGTVFSIFLRDFEDEVRALVYERDVIPALEQMRSMLLAQLDRAG